MAELGGSREKHMYVSDQATSGAKHRPRRTFSSVPPTNPRLADDGEIRPGVAEAYCVLLDRLSPVLLMALTTGALSLALH